MNILNMMYYFQKLQLQFHEFYQDGKTPTLVMLEKVMNRCFKLYQMIDDFMKIFKLIQQKDVS